MNKSPPSGTVTFLAFDICRSSILWEKYPTIMGEVIIRFEAIAKEIINKHSGYIFKTIGDEVMASFHSAIEAARAALELINSYRCEDWGEIGKLAVRFAMYTGSAELRENGDYVGTALNRLSRLLDSSKPGEVHMPRLTKELIGDQVANEGVFIDIGELELEGIGRRENIYKLISASETVTQADRQEVVIESGKKKEDGGENQGADENLNGVEPRSPPLWSKPWWLRVLLLRIAPFMLGSAIALIVQPRMMHFFGIAAGLVTIITAILHFYRDLVTRLFEEELKNTITVALIGILLFAGYISPTVAGNALSHVRDIYSASLVNDQTKKSQPINQPGGKETGEFKEDVLSVSKTLPTFPITQTLYIVYCRNGPGSLYEVVETIFPNMNLEVVGKSRDSNYLAVKHPDLEGFCWIFAQFVEKALLLSDLPVITPELVVIVPDEVYIPSANGDDHTESRAGEMDSDPSLAGWYRKVEKNGKCHHSYFQNGPPNSNEDWEPGMCSGTSRLSEILGLF